MDLVFTQHLGESPSHKEIEDAFETVGIIVRAKINKLCNEHNFIEAEELEKALITINNADYTV